MGYLFVNVIHWGLAGAWAAMALDQVTRSALIWLRFKSGKWKDVKVWKDRDQPTAVKGQE